MLISSLGPLPGRGRSWQGSASFRGVRRGGHKVRKARGHVADAHDAADVFLVSRFVYRPLG